jgi:phosphomannomutase
MDSTILLFDVDGTLTAPRQEITESMKQFMLFLSKQIPVGLVGGSDFSKIQEQLGPELINSVHFVFAENGCVSLKQGQLFHEESISSEVGEEVLKRLINFSLRYISEIDIPLKRGTFIEYRKGMLNLSPIGRNCSLSERNQFVLWDQAGKIREKFVEALRENFSDTCLQFSIGGQISVDVFPKGWDKTHCLKFLEDFRTIHFFGDRTDPGGNDHEIFASERTIGHKVTSPDDTRAQVNSLLGC